MANIFEFLSKGGNITPEKVRKSRQMQFHDKTAYDCGLRYRWDPSLSMNPVRQFAHFMPPWLGMWLKLNRLWWQRNSCYSSTKFLTRRTFCNEDQTQWPMLKFECYLTSLVLVSATLGEREEESPVEWPGSELFSAWFDIFIVWKSVT